MNYMECTTCKRGVIANETGICLGCQQGFGDYNQKDIWQKKDFPLCQELRGKKNNRYENESEN